MLTQLKIELIDEREIEFTYVQGLMYVQPRRAWVEMSQDKIDSSFERQAFYIVHTNCIQNIMHKKLGHSNLYSFVINRRLSFVCLLVNPVQL